MDVAEARPFAVSHSRVRFRGRAVHAAYPETGRNAAGAFTVVQVAVGLPRQQLPPNVRVHGVMTNGGEAPSAIPEFTEGRWYVRAESMAELASTEAGARVWRCFEAGALATGCELTVEPESRPYTDLRADKQALGLYRRNAEAMGAASRKARLLDQ